MSRKGFFFFFFLPRVTKLTEKKILVEFHGWHIHNDLMLRKLFKALSQNSKLGKELKDSSTITSPSPLPCQVRVLGKNQKQKQKQSSTTLTQSKTSFFFKDIQMALVKISR